MTPAMRRATDAVYETGGSIDSEYAARAAVTAALDVDEIARALFADDHDLMTWEITGPATRRAYYTSARAIRAAILGCDAQ